ncbi:MAG: ParB/RepB/Spo0J family partition protein [Firmicutes bacterium]|nr:ParB/RepB/Spo0J family partition protein [Bacillota bacterium]
MENNRKVVELPLDDVLPNRFQPRIKFNEESINELSESIKEHGVIQPIVVRPVGDRYEIIAGERRYKATTLAGLQTIPAIITDLNDKDSAEVALIENVQRQDLTPIEEAISYKKILDMGYLTQENLAEKLGKNQSTVANKLRLLNLDEEVQEALLNEKISERHARSLLKLSNYNDQVKLLNRIINERLTVRKTDEEINKMLNEKEEINKNNVEILDLDEPIVIPEEEQMPEINNNYNIPNSPIIEESSIVKPQNSEFQLPKFGELLSSTEDDSTQGEELTPNKFFNLLDEFSSEETEIKNDEPSESINSDFSSMFNNLTFPDDEITSSPNFGIPNLIENPSNNETKFENKDLESMGNNTFMTRDIKTVINTIRTCTETIEKYGFEVDTEEFDLEDMYQVVIKVNKK